MAAIPQPRWGSSFLSSFSSIFLFFLFSTLLLSLSDSAVLNIEADFPSASSSSPPTNPTTTSPLPLSPPILQVPATLSPIPPPPPADGSNHNTVVKAVAATAASTLFISGFLFFFLHKFSARRRESRRKPDIRRDEIPINQAPAFMGVEVKLKGLIVDEDGLDVLYWRKLQGENGNSGFRREVLEEHEQVGRHKGPEIQRVPLLPVKFPNSTSPEFGGGGGLGDGNIRPLPLPPAAVAAAAAASAAAAAAAAAAAVKPPPLAANSTPPRPTVASSALAAASPPPPPPPPLPPPPPPLPPPIAKKNQVPPLPPPGKGPPLPPPPPGKGPPPPPPGKDPPPPPTKGPPPPPPGRGPPPPPPTRAGGGLASTSRPPPSPPPAMNGQSGSSPENGVGQTKLKPLHWDKVTANADHSMVWDKIGGGSFRFDDDMMEALFGYVATNRKTADRSKDPSSSGDSQPSQVCLLEPRKSQNIAIVLRTLDVTRQEIIEALLQGNGLNADTVEKLTKIAPTQEEESTIRQFSGDPSRLTDAESFLRRLLDEVPSPFVRLDAMLFRSSYDAEILLLKQSLETLESACKELRSRGLFLKLLEAVLKAGNRMNAGTARGNAQAFNLAALRKLSDVKSTDGKTTLLHFVVEEVVRSEGKRCVLNRDRSLGRSNSGKLNQTLKEEREREYLMLGLPVVGGLSVDFSNVKKAAGIDYDAWAAGCSSLGNKVAGIREFLGNSIGGGTGFVLEMKGFVEEATEELKVVKEEQVRVMDLVKKTTEYYQAGSSKEKGVNPLQLFVIIKDFLTMVDQVCIDVSRNLQKRRRTPSNGGSGSGSPPLETRTAVRFPNLPAKFLSDTSKASSSSDSEDEF